MNKMRTILTLIFAISFFVAFAHKDRIERPKIYRFIFQNQDTIRLDNPSDSILNIYSDYIIKGKRKLVNAELLFATGETMIFKNDGKKWTEIKIIDRKKIISIPGTTIEKISQIHFSTIALVWNGNYKRAFSASYFYISFDIGAEKAFDKYPELKLSFTGQKYSKTIIWRQISENSSQWNDF